MPEPVLIGSTTSCLVCKAPLSPLQRLQREMLCGPPCRLNYARLLPNQVCQVCGRPLARDRLAAGLCPGAECLLQLAIKRDQEHARQEEEKRQRQREGLEAAARVVYLRLANQESRTSYPLAIIPFNPVETAPLPRERRDALGEHITDLLDTLAIEQSAEPPPPTVPEPGPSSNGRSPALLAVLAGACSICRGHCCRRGHDRAYLDVRTMARYQRDHPAETPEEILSAYLEKVGDTTFVDSCIYHQPDGCSLPRTMRSDTCNNYYCHDLKTFAQTASDPPRAFFVAGCASAVQVAGFVDVHHVQRVYRVGDTGAENSA